MLVVDERGHGPAAADAARAVVQACRQYGTRTPEELLATAHTAAQGTRGAAVGLAEIDTATRGCASPEWATSPGWCGRPPGVAVWPRIMVLWGTTCAADRCSPIPGLQTRLWCYTRRSPDALAPRHLPGLPRRHPSLIAGVLYRDFTRGRDDVTVLVVAAAPPSGPRDTTWTGVRQQVCVSSW